jgi:hypothetical protein
MREPQSGTILIASGYFGEDDRALAAAAVIEGGV